MRARWGSLPRRRPFAPTAAIFAGSDNAGADYAQSDDGFGVEGDPGARTEPGRAADAAPSAGPDVSPGPGAAVGRVIQRTISVAQNAAGESGPMYEAITGFPAVSAAPEQMPTATPAPATSASVPRPGGQRPVRLQRWNASTGMVPGAAGSSPERAETLAHLANRSFAETAPVGPRGPRLRIRHFTASPPEPGFSASAAGRGR